MPETQEIKTVYIAVDDLNPYDRNARKHGTDDVQAIVESIKEFGFNDPIGVWGDKNTIVEGHGRLLAAKLLGMKYVPCIRLDHLTDEQRRGYALAHNKTAELSRWDDGMLDIELGDITDIDMSLFGFEPQKEKEDKEKSEVEFSEILGEENNYLVLQFKTDIDWLNAVSVFGLDAVKSYSTRKDGEVTKSMERKGIARVLDGAKALKGLVGEI